VSRTKRLSEISDGLATITAARQGRAAAGIRVLPDRLTVAELPLPAPSEDSAPGVPVGIAETDLSPVGLDLTGAEPVFSLVRELGADGPVLSGDPREGAVIGDQRAAHQPPGRGMLVGRRHPPTLIQVAADG
jgi:hypothetical protein